MNEEQRNRLRLARLRSLVEGVGQGSGQQTGRADWKGRSWEPVDCGRGVALLSPERKPGDATEAIVYPREPTIRSLGEALAWERVHRRSTHLNLVLDSEAGDELAEVLSKRASCFAEPLVAIWTAGEHPDRTRMSYVDPADRRGSPDRRPSEQPPSTPELIDVLLDAGVEVVSEGGLVRGEVNGLEVGRIAHGTSSWGTPLDEPTLEVGVGLADRELTAMMHAELGAAQRLARAAEFVRSHRRADAPPHPLNRLVPERWLRAQLILQPDRLGLAELRAAEGRPPRTNLSDRGVAMAAGTTDNGRPVVVAISVGLDIDLVPAAAGAWLELDPHADLWMVVPLSDRHRATAAMADGLTEAARPRLLTVTDDWRTW